MNKKKIVIASVLKPVNDSRNYEKTAISINKSGNYQVYLVGQKVQNLPMGGAILFKPLFSFHRLSFLRFFAGWFFLAYLFRIKPAVIIVTTFELLFPAILFKLFYRGKLIYDVQENYFRNLVYTNSFPSVLKYFMAIGVRTLEYLTRPFVDHYILAEKNYEKEFSFSKNKSTVLENKFRRSSLIPRQTRADDTIQLLYTGTIAANYGIFEAIALAKSLHKKDARIRLKIAGFASNKIELVKLKIEIRNCDFITLIGGDEFVSHQEILTLIASSDFGLISYRPNRSTENCIPTKLYEYLALGLPFLVNKNPLWRELTTRYQAGAEIDFYNPEVEKILTQIQTGKFYTTKPGEEIYWEERELDLMIRQFDDLVMK